MDVSKKEKQKKPFYKRWWFIAIAVVVLIIALAGGDDTTTLSPEDRQVFISSVEEYDYNDIERNPDEYKGKPAVFRGNVVQVTEGSFNTVVYRVATKGDLDNIIYVTYTRAEGETRVLEGDTVTIYGILDGVTTYTSVLGGEITIPSIRAKVIE